MFRLVAALLSETWSFLLVRWKAVGVGVLTFGMLMAVNQAFFARIIDQHIASVREQAGLSSEQFDEKLRTLLSEGAATEEVDRIVAALQQSISEGGSPSDHGFVPTPQNAALYFVLIATPFVFGAAFVALLIAYISWIYFLLISVQDARGAIDAFWRLPTEMLRISLLLPWTLLRSLAWIPMLVMVFASYALPTQLLLPVTLLCMVLCGVLLCRFVLAPVLLLSRQHGILHSASVSAEKMRGKISSVYGMLILGSLATAFVLWLGSLLASIVTVLEARAGMLLWLLCVEIAVAYWAVYQVRLSRAVLLGNR